MFSKLFSSLLRFSGITLTLLFLCGIAANQAQAQTTPLATASFAQGLNHPTGWGLIEQTAVDSYGDWLLVDDANGALYEFPAGGGAEVTLVAAGGLGAGNNPGIAIDSNNNLYLEGNWSNCLLMFPYDTATNTWDGLSTLTARNNSSSCAAPYDFAQYSLLSWNWGFQPWGIAVDPHNNLVIANQTDSNFLFALTVNGSGSSATAGTPTEVIDTMTVRASSVAEDLYGNIYFVEEPPPASSGGLPGVYMVPAGQTGLASDAASAIVRVDPNLPSVTGVLTDASGNLYISDSKDGVFMVPNESGTPNPAAAVLLTPVPATGQVSIDWARHILYIPTNQKQSNGQADVAEVTFNAVEFGSTTPGTPTAAQTVLFGFSASVTPASIVVAEAGTSNPDFAVAAGGSCAAGTTYNAQSNCSVNVTFNPHSAGSVAAELQMLDASGNVLASMPLHGTGTDASVQVLPGAQSAIGAGLKTPSQIAVDAAGNLYVADSGLGTVTMYPQGSGAVASSKTIGTGLTQPTGVAVDGAGDVFIADSGNGAVYEVPEAGTGLNAAGQITLKTGLGTSDLQLAADGLGHLYISDPANHRVVKLGNLGGSVGILAQTETDLTGFNAPSAVAVDAGNNLYVADGVNLYEIAPGTTTLPAPVLTSLSSVTGLAVDPSGAVYVTMTGGTVRIPSVSGTLTVSDETPVAASITEPASIALDALDNIYIADSSALNVNVTSIDAAYNFGTLTTTTSTASQTFTIQNVGNTQMTVTGFSSTPDYSATANTCTDAAVAVNGTCTATVTFNPGPGDAGTLTGQVLVQGNVANSPVGVSATGVGAPLAQSKSSIAMAGTATTDGAPVNVTVSPASGTTPTPTGEVILTVSGNGITPFTTTVPLSGGVAQFDPQNLVVGSYTFAASYSGDRSYLGSNTSITVTVGAGLVTLTQPSSIPSLMSFQMPQAYQATLGSGTGYLVLSDSTGADPDYNDNEETWWYNYPLTVSAADGSALTCMPVYSGNNLVRENCGSVTYTLASGNIDCPNQGGTSDPVDVSSTNGSAPLKTSCLDINTSNTSIPDLMTFYTVTPVYSGTDVEGDVNPNYSSVTGSPVNFWALRNPMVQIASTPPSLTVSAGSSVQATLTLSSVLGYGYVGRTGSLNNYGLPLDLQCDGLPSYASCTFTYSTPSSSDPNAAGALCPGSTTTYCAVNVGPPPNTALSGGGTCTTADGCIGPGTVTMTITTNVPTGEVSSLRRDSGGIAFAAMFGLGLLGLTFRKKARRWGGFIVLACLLTCTAAIAGITACGTTNLSPANSGTATPAGTYAVTVSAKESGTILVPNANEPGTYLTVYGNSNQMSLPYTVSVTVQK